MKIALDQISLKAFIIIFFRYKNSSVVLIDNQSKFIYFLFSKILKIRNIKLSTLNTKISKLEINNKSLFDYIHDIAKEEAYFETKQILNDNEYLFKINEFYKKNTIKLFLLKKLDKEYREYFKKIFYIYSIFKNKDFIFFFEKPKFINLAEFFEKNKFKYFFYENFNLSFNKNFFLTSAFGIYFRNILKKIIGKFSHYKLLDIYYKNNNNLKNILCLTDNNYSNYNHLRKFPSWKKDENHNIIAYDQTTLLLKKSFLDNKSHLRKIFYFDGKLINFILKYLDDIDLNNHIISTQIKLSKNKCLNRRYKNIYKELIIFFNEVQIILSLAHYFKIELFISSQTHLSLNLAAEIVSQFLKFETINFQYSFAHSKTHSLALFSNADNLFLFSEKFKEKFSDQKIFSSKIYETGYLFKITESLKKSAFQIKNYLNNNGAKFVISFFDEGVKFDKWKLSHRDLIYNDLKKLLNFVLNNHEFALIVKPQFAFHKPSKIFNDKIFSFGLKTGRYLELIEGTYRNNILPSQTALISDFTIGYYFGGTASLESALANIPTVMLNPFKNEGIFDDIIKNNDALYKDIDEIIEILNNLKNREENINKFNKFSKIASNSILPILENTKKFEDIILEKLNGRTNKVFNNQKI